MAAGQGFKTFTTGEVLTAGDVNGYLMQGINVFASEAARDAAITAPAEGQFAFTKDNNSLWYYDGAAWVASGAAGDIEGVTAGVGISGGGTSGTVTITNSMATSIDAKGDLVPGTGADTFARLAVGANDTVLTADSSQSTGMKWATPSSGSMTELASGSMSGTKVSLNSISSGYKNLVLIVRDFYSSDNSYMGLTVNDTTGIYAFTGTTSGDNPMTETYQNRQVRYLNSQTDNFLIVTYFDYASSGSYKTAYEQSIYGHLYTANQWNLTTGGDFIRTTSAISSIEMNSTSGSFSAGNYVLYGVK